MANNRAVIIFFILFKFIGFVNAVLATAVGKEHTGEDEDGAEEEPDGDLLVEQPPGEEDGGQGVQVDPVGGDDGTELADDPVPNEEAEHRGDDAEEEKVEED